MTRPVNVGPRSRSGFGNSLDVLATPGDYAAPLETFEAGHSWVLGGSPGGSSNINQATGAARSSSQQVSLVTDTAGGVGTLTRTDSPSVNLTTHHIRVWLKTQDAQQLGELTLRVAGPGGLAAGRYGEWTLARTGVTTSLGANHQEIAFGNTLTGIPLSPADLVLTGAPDLSGITEWQIRFADRNNGQGARTIALNGIDVIRSVNPVSSSGVLVLTFDDSLASQATLGRQVLNKHGIPGTFLTICDYLGTGGLAMTLSQLRALAADGHEVGAHAYAKTIHDNMSSTSQANAALDFVAAKDFLSDAGFEPSAFSYPQGMTFYNGDPCRGLYQVARTTSGVFGHNPLPLVDPHRVRSLTKAGGAGAGSIPVATVIDLIGQATDYNTAVVLTLHTVTSGAAAGTLDCSQADLDLICAEAVRSGIQVATLGQIDPLQD